MTNQYWLNLPLTNFCLWWIRLSLSLKASLLIVGRKIQQKVKQHILISCNLSATSVWRENCLNKSAVISKAFHSQGQKMASVCLIRLIIGQKVKERCEWGRHSVFEPKLPVIWWLCLAELGVTLCILHPLLLLQKIFFWTTFNRFVGHPPVFEGQDDDWDGDDDDHMMEIKKTWWGRYLNNLMRPTIRVGFKCHIILVWTYVSSDIKGHFVFPNCQFRKRWFGPQQAKSKSWLWSLRPFL